LAKPVLKSLQTLSWLTVTANPCIARCQFQKRSQHFIGTNNETLAVAMRVHIQIVRPWESIAET